MSAETQPQDAGRRRRRGAERAAALGVAAARAAAFAVRAARPRLEGRARIDPSGGADSAEGDRDRLSARRRARDAERCRRRRRTGLAARAIRSGAGRSADRARAEGIHPACAEPGAQSRRSAGAMSPSARWRARPIPSIAPADGGRANMRDYQNFLRLGQTLRLDPFLGRLSGRAGRHSRLGPPSRRALRHADAVGQADPRLQPRARAQPRRDRDDQDRARDRRRDARARAVAVHGHQFVLAAEARHADARGRHPDGAAQSGRRADARSPSPAQWRR